jgi:rhodanese-related sulfurtransferase
MALTLTVISIAALSLLIFVWNRHVRDQGQMRQHSISAEELHSLVVSDQAVLIFDVRQPLDFLAYPEIIPGAQRIRPDEVLEKPALIPKEKDSIVYCTCPSDKTSRSVVRRALESQITRIKVLKGGLAGWKSKGYPVETYQEVFQLYAPSMSPPAR